MTDILEPDAATAEEFRQLMADPAARQAFVEARQRAAETGAARRYEHIVAAVGTEVWAVRPEVLALIVDVLAFRVAGGRLSAEEIEARVTAARRPPAASGGGGVAVIPLHGVIMPKASAMSDVSGGTSIEEFRQSFRAAMASPDVSGVVIDVDSPGGMARGVPEMAREIRAARGTKPIVAATSGHAASAAYWLASQADEVTVAPSGLVGSIGVRMAHRDESVKEEAAGIKVTEITSSPFKGEGSPHAPLTDEARAHMQEMVDAMDGMFVSDVAHGRRVPVDVVRSQFGQGRMLLPKAAVAAGMVDRIATVEEVVRGMVAKPAASLPAAPAASGDDDGGRMDALFVRPIDWSQISVAEPTAELEAAVDNSAWDGNRAMGMCSTAGEYRSICAGEHGVGTPDQRQHWALPHHYLGRGPNADGVRAAQSRLPQTQDLVNREAAQRHLDAHMREINPGSASTFDVDIETLRGDPAVRPVI